GRNSGVGGHGYPLFAERKGEDEGESCRFTAGSTTECRLRTRQRGRRQSRRLRLTALLSELCRPARKSGRKRAAYVMRYSCAKFVKYGSRVGLAHAVQQQRHVWGTRQSRWSSGGFAVNPGSAWHVGAPNWFASIHPHQLAKSGRGCKLRRPT